MYYFDSAVIDGPIYLHQVGNRYNEETLLLTTNPLDIDVALEADLKKFFLSSFRSEEYYHFTHEVSLSLNEVYVYVSEILNNPNLICRQSQNLAQTLYRSCVHPNIKGGEFYVAHFKNCLLNGEMVDAVGFFKSETKESFIKVKQDGADFRLIQENGVNPNKLDKGCLVFNVDQEHGYCVLVVDNSNRGEAKYWLNDFLQLERNNDSINQSQNLVSLCKSYIDQLPSDEFDKADKATMINRVVEELNSDEVNVNVFAEDVFGQQMANESFLPFRRTYEIENNISFTDTFEGTPKSIKTSSIRSISRIKLDRNFVVNVNGHPEWLEKGFDDEKKLNYYKLYFIEEK